ncbi:MAG: hypothetical protein E7165_00130 [Firmicutes bacterium]|nr:hypothetical protein [Bacillota bacterium]
MKNNFVYKFLSKIDLEIRGKHIERFIHKLAHHNIELLDIKYFKDGVHIKIYKEDYLKVLNLKSIYEVNVVDASGLIKLKKTLSVNKFVILAIVLGITLLIFLTNIIFEVEVVHSSSSVRNFLIDELKMFGMKEYSLKKSFKEISKIKNEILEKYPDKIEWLEIEVLGTKYVVRVELREIPSKEEHNVNRHVVAKKDALIKKITALNGMVVKEVNNYVKKGDIIISGNVSLNDETKGTVSADGSVFGEVWYTLTVEYPYTYYEERLTGKSKKVIALKFLNKSFELFPSFKNKKVTETVLLKNNLLPIKLVLEHQEEQIIVDQVLTEDEAINKAISLGREKMGKELSNQEYIIDNKVLKVNVKENKVVVDIFFVVYEDITDYAEIIVNDNEKVE